MANSQRKRPKSKKTRRAALKKINDEFAARTGTTLAEAALIRRAEITAERGNYKALERGHKDATRARDAAITRCSEEIEGRRSAEKRAAEHKLSKENEERLRRDATSKLAKEHEGRVRAEAETRAVQAALDGEVDERRAQEERVASLEEEMGRLSLVKARVEKERNNLVSAIFDGDEEGLLLVHPRVY